MPRRSQGQLLSTTAALLVLSATLGGVIGGSAAAADEAALAAADSNPCAANPCNPCAAASPCNPCAAANPCNPCAAANPRNPCAAANPCAASPCAASAGGYATGCTVPRLVEAAALERPCSPCAAASPCNPCAAANPCNPCAAANPCNPCAAANPCNPCAAANPCNPCAAADAEPPELTEAELVAAYACVTPHMEEAYRPSGREVASVYRTWARFSRTAYPAEAHGIRFMNNYANDVGADTYGDWEGLGRLPAGSVLAKDSFIVGHDGKIAVGPLFVMEKRPAGYRAETRDWHYEMIMPGGAVRDDTSIQAFCGQCHRRAGDDDDHLMFLPDQYRADGS